MSGNGKGDNHRPLSVTRETWNKNWDAVFKPKKKKQKKNVK